MTSELVIDQTVDTAPPDGRTLRIQQEAARIAELALDGFQGPAYEIFENDLCRDSMPILRGMLRNGEIARLSQRRFTERGITFFVDPEDAHLLHSSPDARDEIAVDTIMRALKTFRGKALLNGAWSPQYQGPKGPCSLTSFFIGQCIWEFRRVYLLWTHERAQRARQEIALHDVEAFFRLLRAPGHLAEPETILFGGAFMDFLAEQPEQTQAVIRLTVAEYRDTEIADALGSTPGSVRTRRHRFRQATYQAAREGRIWIPYQLHATGPLADQAQRGAE